MKTRLITVCIIIFCISSSAQVPESFSYQAIPRENGAIYPEVTMYVRTSILSGSPTGSSVYTETFNPTTTSLGLLNLQIGKGTPVSGDFTSINWSFGTYYLKAEIDPTGVGTVYTDMGTTQLLSVPYSLYSKTTGNLAISNQEEGDMSYFNGVNWVRLVKGNVGQVLVMNSNSQPVWLDFFGIPAAETLEADPIGGTYATLNGSVNGTGLSTIITFEYGTSTSYGNSITADQSPVHGSSGVNVSASITGLIEETTYHFRIKAVNALGTTYGMDLTFDTPIELARVEEEMIQAYLAENASIPFELKPSGLYYAEVIPGTGLLAQTHDSAYVKYTGLFLNGIVFDTNVGTEHLFGFRVNEGYLIAGFDEGITYMKEGGKSIFLLPSDVAYGPTGVVPLISGYTPLLFYVELIKVVKFK